MKILLLLLALVFAPIPAFADVAENGSGTATNTGTGTSATLSTFTVDAGSNLCLIVALFLGNTAGSGFVANWDSAGTPQLMTQAGTVWSASATQRGAMFYLVNPTPGNKTLTITWTNSRSWAVAAVAFSGANQSTCINTADTQANTNVGPASALTVTVTSDAAGATVAGVTITGGATISSTDSFTEVLRTGDVAVSYTLGGTSNNHQWTGSSSQVYATGAVHVLPYVAATASGSLGLMGVGR